MTNTTSSGPEAALAAKPPYEQAQLQYRNALQDMANKITLLVPGLTWQVKEDSWRGCGAPHADTRGVQAYVYAVFDGPVPDDAWPRALDVVKAGAAALGATDTTTLVDKPGNRDVMFGGPDGVEIEFGSNAATILSVKSDCRLRQADLPPHDEHP